jgi:hypothetical protein
MSKSSLVLLYTVALLTAAASIQSDGLRFGGLTKPDSLHLRQIRPAIRAESRADIFAIKEDVVIIRAQAKSSPPALRNLWWNTYADVKALRTELAGEARMIGRKLSNPAVDR